MESLFKDFLHFEVHAYSDDYTASVSTFIFISVSFYSFREIPHKTYKIMFLKHINFQIYPWNGQNLIKYSNIK